MVKFSIGIPAYKNHYLKECIDSVLNQTCKDFELIIVNDFSPFPIDEIVAQYLDPRIKYYINTQNFGAEHVVDNWNKCLEYSNGDFFVLMGDDDRIEPNFLQEFLHLIERYPDLDVYHCRSLIIDSDSKPVRYTASWPEYETVYNSIWHRLKKLRHQYISDFVYRSQPLKLRGGYYKQPLAWASDDITAYIAAGNKGIAHTNVPVFNYRQSGITISSTGNPVLKMKAILGEEDWTHNFLSEKPERLPDQIVHEDIQKSIVTNYFRNKKKLLIYQCIISKQRDIVFSWYKDRRKLDLTKRDFLLAIVGKL